MKNGKRLLVVALIGICVMVFACSCAGGNAGRQGEMGSGGQPASENQQEECVDLMRQWEEKEMGLEQEKGRMEGMDEVEGGGQQTEEEQPAEAFCMDTTDFAISLLKENVKEGEGGNVMISPVSVLAVLSMTANGAQGDTLSQMMSVMAKNQEPDSLNDNLKKWMDGLTDTDAASLKLANAIWFNEDGQQLKVEDDFLRKNALYYNADIYKAPFNKNTLQSINAWTEEKTDGKIKNLLDGMEEDAVMYLVNTAVFDADWKWIYEPYQVSDSFFTNGEGVQENVPFMYSTERTYIEDENITGFIKPYKEGYRFVALLPKEGISLEECIEKMDGEYFRRLLAQAQTEVIVETGMPKFHADYEAELEDMLAGLGMENAFDVKTAQFQGIGTSPGKNIYISRIIHKTDISVGELGTEAAAATVEEAVAGAADEPEMEIFYVYLKRPFLYAIVEERTDIPVFIGVLNEVGQE
ncbi:hypothetical protein IMSAGC002_03630 [Lachnospiraceae bacterium]|nr:hypothetical protein IMSAGC002_03630 [Lachnospiraceae bacterium]